MGRKNPVVAKIEDRITAISSELLTLETRKRTLLNEQEGLREMLTVVPTAPKKVRAHKAAQTEGANANS